MTYEVIELDVWGNEDDGFFVNDYFKSGIFIEIDNDKDVISQLNASELFNDLSDVSVFNEDEYRIELEHSNGKPAFTLEAQK